MRTLHIAQCVLAVAIVSLALCFQASAFSPRSDPVFLMAEWWMTSDDVLSSELAFSPGGHVPEGFFAASLRKPLLGPISACAALEAHSIRVDGGAASVRFGLLPAIEFTRKSFAVFAGAGVAQVSKDDRSGQTQSASLGWRLQHRALRLELAGRINRFERTELIPGALHMDPDSVYRRDPGVSHSSISLYRDVQLSAAFSRGPFATVARLGGRASGDQVGPRTFGGLDASWQFSPQLALIAGYAFDPSVPEEEIPARRAARAGVRVTLGNSSRGLVQNAAGVKAADSSFRVAPATPGRYTLSCRIAEARTVEISGDFCDWEPRPMTEGRDGWWTDESVLAPGSHRVSIRIDGGPWIAPPGLSSVSDEFGGSAGVFVVR